MKLKETIINEGKTYNNGNFSLAISEIIQSGKITTTAVVRIIPYTDNLETSSDIDKAIIIPFNSVNNDDKVFISDIEAAIEKLVASKGI